MLADLVTGTKKSKLGALSLDPNAGKNGTPHSPVTSKKKVGAAKKPKPNPNVSITCIPFIQK
jgi:hypothetical protein